MKIVKSLILTLIGIMLVFTACDNMNTNPDINGDEGSGVLQVFLTDAPADYESVIIDIQEIRVHRSSDVEADEENNASESGWIVISDEPRKVDLLELTNGKTEFLGEAELEAGRYSQMRLILGDENELIMNGETHHLRTPSAQQSGLKLNIHADIESNSTYTLLLDFDASRSIVQAGNSGNFNLKPVIKTVNLAETGAIGGSVEPAEALPWVYAIAGEDTVAGTRANEQGDFLIIGILEGTYNVAVQPDEEEYLPVVIEGVEVTAPDTTFLETVTLEPVNGDENGNGNDENGE